MSRRVINLLTGLSLLGFVAVVVLWAWSYDTWRLGTGRGQVVVVLARGGGFPAEAYVRMSRGKWDAVEVFKGLRGQASRSVAVAGFEYHRGVTPVGHIFPFTLVAVPMWPFLPLFLALPAARLWLARRHASRARNGRCRRCGYDLRASPGRCPECGTPAATNA